VDYVILPSELDEGTSPLGEAFAKIRRGNVVEGKDAPGFRVFFAQARFAYEAGALVEVAVEVDSPCVNAWASWG